MSDLLQSANAQGRQPEPHPDADELSAFIENVLPAHDRAAVLAHLARYAFGSEMAFFAVLASSFFIAALTYIVAFDSAIESADKDRERFLSALGEGESVIG